MACKGSKIKGFLALNETVLVKNTQKKQATLAGGLS
jgi:hypothetical protein